MPSKHFDESQGNEVTSHSLKEKAGESTASSHGMTEPRGHSDLQGGFSSESHLTESVITGIRP